MRHPKSCNARNADRPPLDKGKYWRRKKPHPSMLVMTDGRCVDPRFCTPGCHHEMVADPRLDRMTRRDKERARNPLQGTPEERRHILWREAARVLPWIDGRTGRAKK